MENEIKKKSMLSGIQPSGDLHLGNYLGAVKNWGPGKERSVPAKPCSRACRAWLDTQLLHHVRRAQPHDAV